jgi:transcriptional regulator with XRE-family HTH domain
MPTPAVTIREARQARGWSQYKLAALVSATQSAVYLWERGERTPRPRYAASLERALGLPDGGLGIERPRKAPRANGRRIKEARQAKGWSQLQLAGRIGIGPAAVSHWEQDRYTPSPRHAARLEAIFGLAPGSLIAAQNDESPSGSAEALSSSA